MHYDEKPLSHGGDIYTKRDIPSGGRLIDFSANLNPFGMQKEIKQAIIENIDSYECYPDPLCRELRAAISQHEKIDIHNILCGNGAADLIFRIAYGLKPKKALLLAPTFSEYEQALKQVDCEVFYAYLNEAEDFEPKASILSEITEEVDIVFICNPNNPTGALAKKDLMFEILQRCKEKDVVLVVDECFMDFVENEVEYSLCDRINEYENLIILKAFTKMYSIAGIRLGYMLCKNGRVLSAVMEAGQSWSVSTVASKCGIAALSLEGFTKKTQLLVAENRKLLVDALKAKGMKCYSSSANYILFYSEDTELDKKLLPYGILIRSCKNYYNLNEHYFRIAVKTKEENEVLINAMRLVL